MSDEKPLCKLCGLEDGACMCRWIPRPAPLDEARMREILRECRAAAKVHEFPRGLSEWAREDDAALAAMSRAISEARAEQRERDARIAAGTTAYDDNLQKSAGCSTTGQRIAAAIRSQDNPHKQGEG